MPKKNKSAKEKKTIKVNGLIKRKNNKRTISFKIKDKEFVLDDKLEFNSIVRHK